MSLKDDVTDLGFESLEEFSKLVASVNLSTSEKQMEFRKWQFLDGTKEGLLKLIEANK